MSEESRLQDEKLPWTPSMKKKVKVEKIKKRDKLKQRQEEQHLVNIIVINTK